MRAAIIGGNYIGKGAEAMMNVTVKSLRERIPDISFRLFGTSEEMLPSWAKPFMQEYRIDCCPVGQRTVYDYLLLPVMKPLGLSWRYYSSFYRSIQGCMALLDIRGFTFIPDNGVRGANGVGYYAMSLMGKHLGVKHIILPQVMGPMNGIT